MCQGQLLYFKGPGTHLEKGVVVGVTIQFWLPSYILFVYWDLSPGNNCWCRPVTLSSGRVRASHLKIKSPDVSYSNHLKWLQQLNALHWRHNERDSVSNNQPHDCLLNRLIRPRSKKTSRLRVTGLCAGNSPVENVSILCCLPQWRPFCSGADELALFMVVVQVWISIYDTQDAIQQFSLPSISPVVSFTKEFNSRLAKRPLVFNGRLANNGLTSLVKEATGGYDLLIWSSFNQKSYRYNIWQILV